jgi:hypothetical protein
VVKASDHGSILPRPARRSPAQRAAGIGCQLPSGHPLRCSTIG